MANLIVCFAASPAPCLLYEKLDFAIITPSELIDRAMKGNVRPRPVKIWKMNKSSDGSGVDMADDICLNDQLVNDGDKVYFFERPL